VEDLPLIPTEKTKKKAQLSSSLQDIFLLLLPLSLCKKKFESLALKFQLPRLSTREIKPENLERECFQKTKTLSSSSLRYKKETKD
jgi:hypothetical protein